MGVVNVTPDSFSDGGVHLDPDAAAAAARRMLEEGAAIVDVGGESTRPGSEGVSLDEELRRVMPVLERLGACRVSIDTAKAEVARRALALGAELVNDVTALRGDPELAGVVADAGAYLCLMHMQGEPRTMQADPRYDDVASEVAAFLEERLAFAVAAGHPGGARLPRPRASASARRRRRTSSSCAGWTSCSRSAGRCSSASRARARSAGSSTPRRDRQARRVARRGRRRVRARRVDLPRPRRPRARRGAHGRPGAMRVIDRAARDRAARPSRRARGGARATGQLFLFDVELEVGEGGRSDRLEDAVDYRDVVGLRARGLGRRARTTCSRRSRPRSPTSCSRASRSSACSVRVRKPERRARPAGRVRRRRRDAAVTRAYVGLGANLGDREATIRAARRALCPGVVAVSALRETEPVGSPTSRAS